MKERPERSCWAILSGYTGLTVLVLFVSSHERRTVQNCPLCSTPSNNYPRWLTIQYTSMIDYPIKFLSVGAQGRNPGRQATSFLLRLWPGEQRYPQSRQQQLPAARHSPVEAKQMENLELDAFASHQHPFALTRCWRVSSASSTSGRRAPAPPASRYASPDGVSLFWPGARGAP
ncbi:hypothetical protein GGR56DRAFT_511049 [Xylariaceae sp. FL0804]|nr:hypothetical protein GGR56DRAFT_511049 [Xylariaceae sp. FL0804]